jgi:predicted MFS family arabinose efflux permease
MLLKVYKSYQNSFKGLSIEIWWLSLITLINRAGTMVIPFLSLYLTKDLGYTLQDVGWIMSAFGLGSVCGAWLGGKLTDKIGFYRVMYLSLFISGVLFVGLQFVHSFMGLCIAIFFLMLIADAFRPAAYVAISAYSKPENRTRSITLIRLAINLGFSLGPAAGGFIIAKIGYSSLFWIDGLTCVIAGIMLIYLLKQKSSKRAEESKKLVRKQSPYKDKNYIIFLIAMLFIAFAFLQYFSTIPLYYKEVHHLSEEEIGWLMALNGFLIFLIEMPLVKYFEQPKFSIIRILIISTLLFAFSFLILNLMSWVGVLAIGMFLMTIGEMLNFPFLNSFAMDRAEKGSQGSYMALFTMTFSIAHIFAHNSGMQLVNYYGYSITWYIMTVCLLVSIALFIWLRVLLEREKSIL